VTNKMPQVGLAALVYPPTHPAKRGEAAVPRPCAVRPAAVAHKPSPRKRNGCDSTTETQEPPRSIEISARLIAAAEPQPDSFDNAVSLQELGVGPKSQQGSIR
jgi:hypothetical protein